MRILVLTLAVVVLAACGQGSAGAQGEADRPASAGPTSLVGAWERYTPDRENPVAYEVLEFFDNGWVIHHDAAGGQNARYATDGGSLDLQGGLAMAWPGAVGWAIEGDTLTLDRAFGGESDWTWVERAPFFEAQETEGDRVPVELPAFLAAATTEAGRNWRPDAVPTALDAQRLPSGDFAITLEFLSPSDGAGLRAIVGRWGFLAGELAPGVVRGHALPTEFADTRAMIATLRSEGNADPLLRASLRVWSKGPVWTLTTLGARGQTRADLDGATGSTIRPEEPPAREPLSNEEYIAWYNAQWDAIAASFARSRGPSGGGSDPWSFDGGYAGSSDTIGGDGGGGGCAYSSHAACNAAAAGDLWAADRIEQGRSSSSEESWYD